MSAPLGAKAQGFIDFLTGSPSGMPAPRGPGLSNAHGKAIEGACRGSPVAPMTPLQDRPSALGDTVTTAHEGNGDAGLTLLVAWPLPARIGLGSALPRVPLIARRPAPAPAGAPAR